ncbi:TOBE domain-containing protein, partial [Corynebacterium propinquum]
SDAWLSQHEPDRADSQTNSWTGRITDISVPHPTVCDVTVDTHGEQVDITISPHDAHELGLELDEEITWGIDPAKISVTALAAED